MTMTKIFAVKVKSMRNEALAEHGWHEGDFCREADSSYGKTFDNIPLIKATFYETREVAARAVNHGPGSTFAKVIFEVVELALVET